MRSAIADIKQNLQVTRQQLAVEGIYSDDALSLSNTARQAVPIQLNKPTPGRNIFLGPDIQDESERNASFT